MPERSVGHSATQSAGSRFAPAVMKKMPSKMPSKGLMSASICCLLPGPRAHLGSSRGKLGGRLNPLPVL